MVEGTNEMNKCEPSQALALTYLAFQILIHISTMSRCEKMKKVTWSKMGSLYLRVTVLPVSRYQQQTALVVYWIFIAWLLLWCLQKQIFYSNSIDNTLFAYTSGLQHVLPGELLLGNKKHQKATYVSQTLVELCELGGVYCGEAAAKMIFQHN